MKEFTDQYRIGSNKKIKLEAFTTTYKGPVSKKDGKAQLVSLKKELSLLQEKLYAGKQQSLLILFQAMDAAGKDSVIKHVFSGVNPQGCTVKSFKTPSDEEYAHDFLWRHSKALPEMGMMGMHNRSHYENVLVCKVHPEYVLRETLPQINDVKDLDNAFWEKRYQSIRDFESHLTANGTTILKFFLHLSPGKQKSRFKKRIEDPEKQWKFLTADLEERLLWNKYMDAYEKAIVQTSTETCPWYIIPADKKWYTRLAVAEIINATLKKMDPGFPVSDKEDSKMLSIALVSLNNDGI